MLSAKLIILISWAPIYSTIFRLDIGKCIFNHVNEFVSISELTESREVKIPLNPKDITERFLFSALDRSFIQQIIERKCKSILFLIASDWFSEINVYDVFWCKSQELQYKIISLEIKWVYSLWQLMHLGT